jgi:hypothetical protein
MLDPGGLNSGPSETVPLGGYGWVMLTGSDPAILSSRPWSSFRSSVFSGTSDLLFAGTSGSAPRLFGAERSRLLGCTLSTILWSDATLKSQQFGWREIQHGVGEHAKDARLVTSIFADINRLHRHGRSSVSEPTM